MQLLTAVQQFFFRVLNPRRFRAEQIIATLSTDQQCAVHLLETAAERYNLLIDGHTSVYLIAHRDVVSDRIRDVFVTAATARDFNVPDEVIDYLIPNELRRHVRQFTDSGNE